MEKNYWQINDDLYKVYMSADVFTELEKELEIQDVAKYIKDGDVYAYDIIVKKNRLQEVLKRLEEFDC
jgi:hypothetical protein|tara:strand:- start:30 stop:233 length:204 start_codon:yes stop_codon:yes gene_type:complete